MDNIKKNFIWNIIGTTINAFNSLFLMIIVTRVNNVFDAGIFTFAFSTATLFNVIGVYAGRIYQVTDSSDLSDKDYLINRILSCFIMLVVSVIFVMLKNYDLSKQMVIYSLCFLKMLEAFVDVLYGYFQKENNLYKVGISLTVKNVLGLIAFIVVDLICNNVILSIISFIVIYVLVMIFYDFKNIEFKKIKKMDTNFKNIFSIFVNGFATFAVSFLTIYIINSSKYAIDNYMSDDLQAAFGIIIMPATVMILVAQFIIHPFLVKITEELKSKNYKNVNLIIIKICGVILLIGLIGIIIAYIFGIPVLEIIYNVPLKKYCLDLCMILLGATFYACTSVINTVLIASRHTLIQMIIYILISIFTLIMANILVSKLGVFGASLNFLLTMILCLVSFIITYIIIIGKEMKI